MTLNNSPCTFLGKLLLIGILIVPMSWAQNGNSSGQESGTAIQQIKGLPLQQMSAVPLAGGSSPPQYVDAVNGKSSDELVKLLLTQNKDLEAARKQISQAEGRLKQAGLIPNPSIEVAQATDKPFEGIGEGSFSIAFVQPLEVGGQRGKRIRMAQATVEMMGKEVAEQERQMVAQLRALFGQALSAENQLQLLGQVSNLNQEMLRVMRVRLNSGDASQLDQSLLQTATSQADAQNIQVENQLTGFMLQIKTLVGMSPQDSLMLRGALGDSKVGITEETALARAFENRPDLHAGQLREAVAEAGVRLARAGALPVPSAYAKFVRDTRVFENVLEPGGLIDRAREIEFGVSVPLPLFHRNQGAIAEAVSVLEEARARRESLEQIVRRDVALAFRRFDAARRSLEIFNQTVLPESQTGFRIVRLAYELGEIRLLDLITQQRMLVDSQTAYTSAENEYFQSVVDLERAVGGPLN